MADIVAAHLPSVDVPQADRLESVRTLVQAVLAGFSSTEDLGREADLSERHVAYYLQAARILGLLQIKPDLKVSVLGERLLATHPRSPEEVALIREAIISNCDLQKLAGDFLSDSSDRSLLAARLLEGSDLSPATAERRAGTLLAWRQYLVHGRSPPAVAQVPPAPVTQSFQAPQLGPSPSLSIDDLTIQLIRDQMRKGKLVLMTGAGFSCGAQDTLGRPLPSRAVLARELWEIAFPGKAFEDGSTLGDVFAVAINRNKAAATRLLCERLTVDPLRIPDFHRLWYSLPWRKIYTLNVDTLDLAITTQFQLPRKLLPISAVPGSKYKQDLCGRDEVRVLHLNGCLADGPEDITFSAPQYGRRHGEQDAVYAELATDLLAYTFIFVGTPLDESILWHHIELREARLTKDTREFRPRSFIVCPQLTLPRQGLLAQYKITWIAATAESFANDLLSTLGSAPAEGIASLQREHDLGSDRASNVRAVSELVANPTRHRTEYLLGEHPTWADIIDGRAAVRTSDDALLALCMKSFADQPSGDPAPIVAVSGTGGAGKSTSLMRAALRLSADGEAVGWVGTETEVSPNTLGNIAERSNTFSILVIDDMDRYGLSLPSMLRRICNGQVKLVVGSLRASKVDVTVHDPALAGIKITDYPIPHLTDGDIDLLLDVLTREHRLGKLKGLSRDDQRAKLKEHAGRQILVALIQATSGERFEEKVLREWRELPDRHRMFYSMISLAGALGIAVTKSELLLAGGPGRGNDDIAALALLAERRIVTSDGETNLFRPRHRLIAETLLDEIKKSGQDLSGVIESLAFAVSSGVSPDMVSNARPRRLMKIILNNEYVFRNAGIDPGRKIYEAVEENLHWDHHYWLQRGIFELQEGSLRFAEQCLDQAMALEPDDPLVDTAYSHMLLRKAVSNPGAGGASEWVISAVENLKRQIQSRGSKDPYPYHVLGIQAIAWFTKAPWPTERRKTFLEDVLRLIRSGVAALPRRQELAKLEKDILQTLLALQIR